MPDDIMSDDEIAFRAAINVLRDSIESGRNSAWTRWRGSGCDGSGLQRPQQHDF
jgi:hypothetical protein